MIRCALLLLPLCLMLTGAAGAHEMRPAYLEISERAADQYSVLWKVPAAGDKRLGLYVRMPDACKTSAAPVGTIVDGAYYERWTLTCAGGLAGHEISIDGLRTTLTDVLVRVGFSDGTTQVSRLTPQSPVVLVTGRPSMMDVARTYFLLGVEHILTGLDHLLFVLALMLLIREPWTLVKTITAFTVAHSITLAGATLGLMSLPQKPVEAVIALSIAFVARELLIMKPGERRLSQAYPWLVAFSFGLLHGFGFAGALKEIGLPQIDVPLALLTFNLGVEAGQLLFVASLLFAFKALAVLFKNPLEQARPAAAYAIGVVATFWLVTRVADFWS
ncbi:MAG: HupE/UreJ family protein [Proteobacteria bacterium]|nr:HupE/UreJ family protein [Pseudomonadota bacterium]